MAICRRKNGDPPQRLFSPDTMRTPNTRRNGRIWRATNRRQGRSQQGPACTSIRWRSPNFSFILESVRLPQPIPLFSLLTYSQPWRRISFPPRSRLLRQLLRRHRAPDGHQIRLLQHLRRSARSLRLRLLGLRSRRKRRTVRARTLQRKARRPAWPRLPNRGWISRQQSHWKLPYCAGKEFQQWSDACA